MPAVADATTNWTDSTFGACTNYSSVLRSSPRASLPARPTGRPERRRCERAPMLVVRFAPGTAQTCPATTPTTVVSKLYIPLASAADTSYAYQYRCTPTTCPDPPSPWYTDLNKSLWISGQCRYKPCVNPCKETYDTCDAEASKDKDKSNDCKCLAGALARSRSHPIGRNGRSTVGNRSAAWAAAGRCPNGLALRPSGRTHRCAERMPSREVALRTVLDASVTLQITGNAKRTRTWR